MAELHSVVVPTQASIDALRTRITALETFVLNLDARVQELERKGTRRD